MRVRSRGGRRDEHCGHDSAVKLALGLYIAYNAAATVASVPGGRLGDRRSNLLVLVLGVLCFGVAYAGLALVGASIGALAVVFVAAGVAIGFVETAEHAAVAEHAPVQVRGSAFGTLAAIQSLGNFAASAIAGLLWTTVSGWGEDTRTYRLYIGATPETPVEGMFSFVPCRPEDGARRGFARPALELGGLIDPNTRMQARMLEAASASGPELWQEAVETVQSNDLALATRLEL